MTYKLLQVYHSTASHFAYYSSKHYDKSRFDVEGFNLDENPESSLIEKCGKYDFIHFWAEASEATMQRIRQLSPSTFVSISNHFGDPIPRFSSEPWDVQVHVTKSVFAKYCKRNKSSPARLFGRNVVNYLPIDTAVFDPEGYSASEIDRVRSSLGFRDHDLVISRTGRPDMWKWDLFHVGLLERLLEFNHSYNFLVVGSIPRFVLNEFRRRSLESRVHVVPYAPSDPETDRRTASLLALSDVYAHSAFIGESCGMSILEAMSMARPIVVTSKPWADNAPTEYINNGQNGFLATQIEEAARLVERIVNNPKPSSELARRGRETILKLFDAGKATRNFETIFSNPREDWAAMLTPTLDEIRDWVSRDSIVVGDYQLALGAKALFIAGVRLRRANQLAGLTGLWNAVREIPKPQFLKPLEIVL
jgi:glycosyltransferase involved in cell wall biosynthesis